MANKPDWLNQRSAAIPIINDQGLTKIVLVTTKSKNNWIFPKGQVELDMTPFDSAAKEAIEEAGVIGEIEPNLFDEYQHNKWGGDMCVKVYTLNVEQIQDEWLEMHDRNRQIVTLEEAIQLVKAEQQETLKKLQQHLTSAR